MPEHFDENCRVGLCSMLFLPLPYLNLPALPSLTNFISLILKFQPFSRKFHQTKYRHLETDRFEMKILQTIAKIPFGVKLLKTRERFTDLDKRNLV